MKNNKKQAGFTLVELMVTISIAAILLGAAIPSFKAMLFKNNIIAYSSDFKLALYHAQNEAIKRNIRVTVKTKTTGNDLWEDGWNIFEDRNANGIFDTLTEELIQTYTPTATHYTLKSSSLAYNTDISFNSLGEPVTTLGTASSGEFRICDPDNDTALSRTIKASFSGNIKMTVGTSTCP